MVKKMGFISFSVIVFFSLQTIAAEDTQLLEQARESFRAKDFGQSIALYSQIEPSSDFWLDALEERAWAALRLGKYEQTLADLQSTTSAIWSTQVGPESYLLSAFASLKVCDYKAVMSKISLFKKRMLIRVHALESILNKPLTNEQLKIVENLRTGPITMSSLGANAEQFPRYFFRDRILLSILKPEAAANLHQRLRELAKQDLDEISLNLKKMKLIEVELIQSVLLSEVSDRSGRENLKFSKVNSDKSLVFPVNDEEIWIDEVGHFQVKLEKCSPNQRKAL